MNWEFQHSFVTRAKRADAWAYWSDFRNHETEPGVERIELDGPFQTGTLGRTIAKEYTQEWKLLDVVEQQRFTIVGSTADGRGSLSFAWQFEDDGADAGTRMTQRIEANGANLEEYWDVFRQMEQSAPEAMAKLCSILDELAGEKA